MMRLSNRSVRAPWLADRGEPSSATSLGVALARVLVTVAALIHDDTTRDVKVAWLSITGGSWQHQDDWALPESFTY